MSAIAEILALVNENPNETLDALIKRLDAKKEFVVGNYQLSSLRTIKLDTEGSIYNYFSFKPELSGNIKLRISNNSAGQSISSNMFTFYVYKDDALYQTISPSNVETQDFTIKIDANHTYRFAGKRTDWSSYQYVNMQLFGDIKILGYYETQNL